MRYQDSATYRNAARVVLKTRRRAAFAYSEAEQVGGQSKKHRYGSESDLQLR